MEIIGQVITMAIGMAFMLVVVTILDILEVVITLIMVEQYLISQEVEEPVGVQSPDQILVDLPQLVQHHQVQKIIVVMLP
jgi:D-ribose pyranose/furanose isomerase RbsD